MTSQNYADHAVVIGGSIAGLLTARVLTNHFARVTVIERDHLPETPAFRLGAPHARHAHGLLVRGQEILEAYFPGMKAELLAGGATRMNLGRDLGLSIGGVRVKPFESKLEAVGCSRPLLENALYKHLRFFPQVQVLDGRDVVGLKSDESNSRVTAIHLQKRGLTNASIHELPADLVVDAGGRSSKAPAWLQELGYTPPEEITIDAQAGYASRIYRPMRLLNSKAIYAMPKAPHHSRGGILTPLENDRWLVTLTGLNGDHPPLDDEGFMAFAESVPAPEFYATIAMAEPLTEPYGYRQGANRLRRYEKLPRHLEGLLAVGDAVCAFNPVYGQGMTVAALGALTLDQALTRQRSRANHKGLARHFFQQLARVNAGPWQMATGQDVRWPAAGAQPAGDGITRLIQRYFDQVLVAMVNNGEVAELFSQVQNMLKAPIALFHPTIVWQVMRAQQTSTKPKVSAQGATIHAHYI